MLLRMSLEERSKSQADDDDDVRGDGAEAKKGRVVRRKVFCEMYLKRY